MNYENMFNASLMGRRVAVVNLPTENRDKIIDAFRKKAAHCVTDPVKERKEFFKILSNYRNKGEVVLFLNQDSIIKKRHNSQFNDILNYFTDEMYNPDKPLHLEDTKIIWALEYDSFKIPGFTEYHGRMMFITDLDANSINDKVTGRHCFEPESNVVYFGEIDETMTNEKGY